MVWLEVIKLSLDVSISKSKHCGTLHALRNVIVSANSANSYSGAIVNANSANMTSGILPLPPRLRVRGHITASHTHLSYSDCAFVRLCNESFRIQPIMISGILIFNQKGENLIFRAFRNDCRPRLADVFRIQVISNPLVRSPILTLGSTTFSHVKHENIFIVAVTKGNANAALVFEFLYRLTTLGKSYFGKFDEEAVKNNFVLIYELLDGGIAFMLLCIVFVLTPSSRNPRLWIPTKHRDRHPQDVHYHRGCQVREKPPHRTSAYLINLLHPS